MPRIQHLITRCCAFPLVSLSFHAAKKVLAKFDEQFPHWKGRGYEIAGFGWWQGHRDGGEAMGKAMVEMQGK